MPLSEKKTISAKRRALCAAREARQGKTTDDRWKRTEDRGQRTDCGLRIADFKKTKDKDFLWERLSAAIM
jgi:hypothetical protein